VSYFRCVKLNDSGNSYCEFNYNGLGLQYQLLAGPAFIAVFTIVGVIIGVLADNTIELKCYFYAL
jgi:hypothetical protein